MGHGLYYDEEADQFIAYWPNGDINLSLASQIKIKKAIELPSIFAFILKIHYIGEL